MTTKLWLSALATCKMGCSPLLDANFDGLSEGTVANGTLNLPGAPSGDQMLVSSEGGTIAIGDGVFDDRHLSIPTKTGDGAQPAVTFRPVQGSSNSRIFISYDAVITGASARGRVVFHNMDAEGSSDRVPDMTLDFRKDDAQVGDSPVTPTGWRMHGIGGEHSVLISINPDGDEFSVYVTGDGVTNSPNIIHFSSTDDGWLANPPNFEITLTTDPGGGTGSYQIDNLLITES